MGQARAPAAGPGRKRRPLLANLALAAAALAIAFAIPEAVLRVVKPRIAQDLFRVAEQNLPGLQEMAADTERYVRERGIRQPPTFFEASDLLWSLKPNYDHTITKIPWVEGKKRIWRLKVNAQGLRGAEVSVQKPPGTLRVICLGDSVIFGEKLDEGETIPERLEHILAAKGQGRPIEVINGGVPGYSSRQGLELWRTKLRELDPDVVTIAFGFNDQWPSSVSDAEVFPPEVPVLGPAIGFLRRMETYKVLRAVLLALRGRLENRLEKPEGTGSGTRVSLPETEANIRALVREVKAQGAAPVVVHTALERDAIRETLERVAQEESVAFVDAVEALQASRAAYQRSLAAELRLAGRCPDPGDARSGAVFRVILPPSIPREGDLLVRVFGLVKPAKISMSDDGLRCDERKSDGVWTGLLPEKPGTKIHYVYAQRRPDGLEVDEFHGFPWAWRTRFARPIRGPDAKTPSGQVPGEPGHEPSYVDTFNRYDLMSEQIHPNAEGAAVMARAVAEEIAW